MNIKDVAKKAGVSISTVSNALNGGGRVSEETRRAILEAAKELGYVPNINARLMKSRRTGNIGLFLNYIDGPFYAALIPAVYHACLDNGYAMFLHVEQFFSSRRTAASILSCNIDGAVVLNDHLRDEEIAQINQRGLPLVFMDREITMKGTGSILIDNQKGVTQEVEYLAHTGHKRVAYIEGWGNHDGITRLRAFRQAMNKVGMPVDEALIMQGSFDRNMAYNSTRILYASRVERPDAIVCANDEMALGCIRALNDMDVRVPRDVSVVGFDDIPIAAQSTPPLTTVHYSMREFAGMAVSELMRLMGDREAQGQIAVTDVSLVLRDSVALRYSGAL